MASTRWEYDAGGRLAQSCDTSDPDTDCDDGGSAIVRAIVPTYDAVGRTTRIDTYAGAQTTLALRTTTTYLGDGQPAQTKAYEGASPTLIDTLDFGYDELGRPTSITRDGSTVIADQTWNPDGTLATRTDGDAGAVGTSTFGYDWAQRLVSVDRARRVQRIDHGHLWLAPRRAPRARAPGRAPTPPATPTTPPGARPRSPRVISRSPRPTTAMATSPPSRAASAT